mmetsp:Transcript_10203/g.17084  ORF Transcript_10203/g.17084 Transcript_10203/m.17084 type:complete len:204 (+) Transcript_10203:887-1498(+)
MEEQIGVEPHPLWHALFHVQREAEAAKGSQFSAQVDVTHARLIRAVHQLLCNRRIHADAHAPLQLAGEVVETFSRVVRRAQRSWRHRCHCLPHAIYQRTAGGEARLKFVRKEVHRLFIFGAADSQSYVLHLQAVPLTSVSDVAKDNEDTLWVFAIERGAPLKPHLMPVGMQQHLLARHPILHLSTLECGNERRQLIADEIGRI